MADKALFDVMLWSCLAAVAGLPAAVAPAMPGADGLPRGVQIIAASFAHILRPRSGPRLERDGEAYVKQFAVAANAWCKLYCPNVKPTSGGFDSWGRRPGGAYSPDIHMSGLNQLRVLTDGQSLRLAFSF
ncbi:MAG: hypothetical protein WBW81_10950 [Methylocella sp.]